MMNAKLMLIGMALLGLGLLLLLIFLILLARRISYYSKNHKAKRAPWGVSYIAIFFALILLTISWFFFRAANDFKWFRPFRPLAKICLVDISRTSDPVKSMRVMLYTLKGDSLKENPEFYLSGNTWKLEGQYVQISGYLRNLFPAPLAFKFNDMLGNFAGQAEVGIDKQILVRQALDDGPVNLYGYFKVAKYLRSSLVAGEFETEPIMVKERERYWLSLSESGQAILEPITNHE
jgi:hypothetical protein